MARHGNSTHYPLYQRLADNPTEKPQFQPVGFCRSSLLCASAFHRCGLIDYRVKERPHRRRERANSRIAENPTLKLYCAPFFMKVFFPQKKDHFKNPFMIGVPGNTWCKSYTYYDRVNLPKIHEKFSRSFAHPRKKCSPNFFSIFFPGVFFDLRFTRRCIHRNYFFIPPQI